MDEPDSPDPSQSGPSADDAQPRRSRDPFIGELIGQRYRVEKRLGRGGYGAVYRARHIETDGRVALKLMRLDLIDDETVIRRFTTEAQNTHKLHHPNTVRLADFGQTDDGVLYLAMEFVDGLTLSEVVRDAGRLPAARVVHIAEQILKSLGEAHRHGVIHRDIKPANIMLVDQFGAPDFVKVLDFGISRSMDASTTNTQGAVGTPKYMAPEQWRGERVDGRADLYSLGCVMYEMLAGRLPFVPGERARHQVIAYMTAHLSSRPPHLRDVAPGACPPELAELVMQLLEKHPDARPVDVDSVLRSLDAIKRSHALAHEVEWESQDLTIPERLLLEAGTVTPDSDAPSASLPAPGPDKRELPGDVTHTDHHPGVGEVSGEVSDTTGLSLPGDLELSPPAEGRRGPRPLVVALGFFGLLAAGAIVFLMIPGDTPEDAGAGQPAASRSGDVPRAGVESPPPEATPDARPPAAEAPPATTLAVEDRPTEAPPAAPAVLVIESVPPGADVRAADGAILGPTPLTLKHPPIEDGARLELTLEGHRRAALRALFPAAGDEKTLPVELKPLPVVALSSRPRGATVTIEETGAEVGQTPLEWTVPQAVLDRIERGEPVTLTFARARHRPAKEPLTEGALAGGAEIAPRLKKRGGGGHTGSGDYAPPIILGPEGR